jgi:hypothetical protein
MSSSAGFSAESCFLLFIKATPPPSISLFTMLLEPQKGLL